MNLTLIENLKSLVSDERRITSQILEHLEAIEKKRLYFELGYSSLYLFLRQECRYSEGQAYRRIEAMRVTKGEPELREKIKTGILNVSVLATASRFLKKSRVPKKQVLAQLENKSQKETLELFQKLDPERALLLDADARDQIWVFERGANAPLLPRLIALAQQLVLRVGP